MLAIPPRARSRSGWQDLHNPTAMSVRICHGRPGDTDRSPAYVHHMFTTLLVIGGVLVGLLLLLALIVALSARPATRKGSTPASPWMAQTGRPHPDAWSPMTDTGTSEISAIR